LLTFSTRRVLTLDDEFASAGAGYGTSYIGPASPTTRSGWGP